MKFFFATAIFAACLLVFGTSSEPLPVDYNGVRALVAQIVASLKS